VTRSDIGGYVSDAKRAVAARLAPAGYALSWSGQYENMLQVRERLGDRRPDHAPLIFRLLSRTALAKAMLVMAASRSRHQHHLAHVPSSAIVSIALSA
jgi:Cu(I)/Ag(I) efflux system membrane protein CusA/SilA